MICRPENLYLRALELADCDFLYHLQTIPGMRQYFLDSKIPSYEDHQQWFDNYFAKEERLAYVIVYQGNDCGFVRLDLRPNTLLYDISILLDPAFSGLGLGTLAVNLAIQESGAKTVYATVHEENTGSIKTFIRAGFIDKGEGKVPFLTLMRD